MTRAFAHLGTDEAPLYRAVMRVFVEAKSRFVFHLREQEVVDAIRIATCNGICEAAEVQSAIMQLCQWGNLQTDADTTNVSAVEDFYDQPQTFKITRQGEAAERALARFVTYSEVDETVQYPGLSDIRHVLQDLKHLTQQTNPDAGPAYRHLLALRSLVDDLTSAAQTFLARLDRRMPIEPGAARRLADYGQRFIDEVVLEGNVISGTMRDVEESGLDLILRVVAARSIRDSIDPTPEAVARVANQWRSEWERLRSWFISGPAVPSHCERLRERARTAIPALLRIITRIQDAQNHRIDRASDFRVLARWFAQAESDDEAHMLWRAAFGLAPARHLMINDASLDDREAQHISPNTSWLDAPPLTLSTHGRDYGNSRTHGLSRMIDRSAEKEKLKTASHDDAERLLGAQRRLGSGGRIRLSELEHLEIGEFELFLDVLGDAVSARVFSAETVEVVSGDGCLKVTLEPTDDGRDALILTADGIFSGPDQWISIERISSCDMSEVFT